MSARRTSPSMLPSRTRVPVEARQPRHMPRTRPDVSSIYTTHSSMSQPNYGLASGAPEYTTEVDPIWQPISDAFYPGNDSSYIPTSSVAPTDLSNTSYWNTMTTYDVDSSCTSSTSSGSSSSTRTCISPPMSEAELMHADMYHTSSAHLPIDQSSQYLDPWVNPGMMPLTPPADPLFDNLELFNTGKTDPMAFVALPEAAMPECEYLGVSKLQFSRLETLRPWNYTY